MIDSIVTEVFLTIFCVSVLFLILYLAYFFYLKKYKGFRFQNGVPETTILRNSSLGSTGFKHFSTASFRASQFSMSSTDRSSLRSSSQKVRPATPQSTLPNIPEIQVV